MEPLCGVVTVAIAEEPDTFNFFVTNSAYSTAILENLWPSLYSYGPDLNPYPDLATNLLIETHSDNPDVTAGHTRFTIDLIHNATWSDGVPLTADDVTFTVTYMVESSVYGNPAITEFADLIGAYNPTTYRSILEYNTERYWHMSNFASLWIIPKHIFNNATGIGYAGWDMWNPVYNPAAPQVTCGPFLFDDYEPDHLWYSLVWNPLFHYRVDAAYHEIPSPPDAIVSTTAGFND